MQLSASHSSCRRVDPATRGVTSGHHPLALARQ